ncbi:MAG: acyl-CoA dehydrogenase family protein [Burkholderiales bacterium]|nr:acyl-CoA dehydrogenase family protein [Burkholderiales bacterium]
MADIDDGRTDERRMLAASVADFARRATDMARVRKWRGVAPGFDRALWREMAALGWTGLLLPERFGGMALGFAEMAEVSRGLARVLMPEPLVACAVLAARALGHCDNEALGAELLPRIAAGELIAALAWQEQAGDLGSRAPVTEAALGSGRVVLNGAKRFVAGAAGADGFIVSARAGAGVVLVWVPAATPGLSVRLEAMADGRFAGRLELADARLPEKHILAPAEIAQSALDRAVSEATVMAAAELLGVMSRTLEMTLDYLRTRVQFGRSIGSFQALQHRAVDLYVQEQLASVALADAVSAIDDRPDDPTTAAAVSRAKARCSDAGSLITRQAIQMHGAIGFTEDSDVGLYVKRALTLSAWLGNSAYHRRRFAATASADAQ